MAKQIDVTESFSIHPTGATNTSNMSASSSYPAANAYTDSDSTTYARYSLSRSTTGYTHYTFTLPDIPSGATITSLTATVKVYVNNTGYVTNTVCQFYTNTTAKGSNYTFASTNSSNVVNMTNTGTWTVAELQNLRLRIGGTGGSQNNSKYITVYGATVTITYRLQGTAYTIDASSIIDNITVDPATQDVLSGGSGVVTIWASDASEFVITDNGVNIFNQLVSGGDSGSGTYIPSSYANLTNASINSSYPITRAYHDADQNSQYARIDINSNTTGYINLLFDFSEIPEDATITSVSVRARLRISATNRITSSTCQLYNGSTAKGSGVSFQNTTSGGTIVTPSAGSWTRSELDNLRLRMIATRNSSGNSGYIYIYGADITIVYTITSRTYTYTISNINTDHVIIVGQKFYIKQNNVWVECSKIYLKQNGAWIEQDLSYLSDNNIKYLKQGG